MQHVLSFTIENNIRAKLNLKPIIIKYFELLPYILPEHKDVSKIATLLKQILKQKPMPIFILSKKKKLQLLNLVFVGKALFKYFAKQKNVKFFQF